MSKKFYVLAANHSQYLSFMRENGFTPGVDGEYIDKAANLMGLDRGFTFFRVGTWYNRPDLSHIDRIIREREGVRLP